MCICRPPVRGFCAAIVLPDHIYDVSYVYLCVYVHYIFFLEPQCTYYSCWTAHVFIPIDLFSSSSHARRLRHYRNIYRIFFPLQYIIIIIVRHYIIFYNIYIGSCAIITTLCSKCANCIGERDQSIRCHRRLRYCFFKFALQQKIHTVYIYSWYL